MHERQVKGTHDDFKAELQKAVANKYVNGRAVTWRWIANKLGEKPGRVHRWLKTGRFPREHLHLLASILGWEVTPTSLDERYDINWANARKTKRQMKGENAVPLLAALSHHDNARDALMPKLVALADGVPDLYAVMMEDDFFCFTASTISPLEHRKTEKGEKLAEAISGAISRGAIMLYFYPTRAIIEDYYQERWSFQGVVSEEGYRRGAGYFRTLVQKHLINNFGYSPEQAWEASFRRLGNFWSDDCPLFCPGISWGFLGTARPDQHHTVRVGIRLPDNAYGGILILPREQYTEFRFVRYVRAELKKQISSLDAELVGRQKDEKGTRERIWQRELASKLYIMLSGQDVLREQSQLLSYFYDGDLSPDDGLYSP